MRSIKSIHNNNIKARGIIVGSRRINRTTMLQVITVIGRIESWRFNLCIDVAGARVIGSMGTSRKLIENQNEPVDAIAFSCA